MSKAERTRQMIIEQAAPIFNQKGIAGTSIDDVLKAAGVAKGCLYGHFESKEDLSYATIDYMLVKMLERRESFLNPEQTAKGKLYAFMEMHKNPLVSIFKGGCPILNFSAEADDTNPVIKEKIQNYVNGAIKTLTDITRKGISDREYSEKLNPEEFGTKMYGALEGGIMMCRLMQNISPIQSIVKGLKSELDLYYIGDKTN